MATAKKRGAAKPAAKKAVARAKVVAKAAPGAKAPGKRTVAPKAKPKATVAPKAVAKPVIGRSVKAKVGGGVLAVPVDASAKQSNAYVALLRAINVGGTGKLPMSELRDMCAACGFGDVATYIQSGNVVFRSDKSPAEVKRALEASLEQKLGKPYGAIIRSAAEMAALAAAPPFPHAAPNQLLVMFFDEAPPQAEVDKVAPPGGEELLLRGRELYVHFPMGAGDSKLRLPFAKLATARNLNTVRTLVAMSAAL